jgi:hypothetical protein
VRDQGTWVTADSYQRAMSNARTARIAYGDQAFSDLVSKSAANAGQPGLFLLSFATRVDAVAAIEEAKSFGLEVREIHLSIGETQHAFPLIAGAPTGEQLLALRKYLFDDLAQRAAELRAPGELRSKQQTHWRNQELLAIESFLRNYGGVPLVVNGLEVTGLPRSVNSFVNDTRIPVLAVEPSSPGFKRFAIPLEVYREYADGK